MIDFETFHGQPELEIAVNDQAFDEPVEAVNRHLSNLGADHFMQLANEPERFGSMQYGLLWGDDDRSSKAVIPMPAPFGNGVWPHILARAEAIRFMAAEAGLHDRQGNPVPILVTAAPSMHSAFDILPQDVTYLKKHGDFGSIAAKHVYLMNRLGFGCVAGFAGYSQGSVIGSPLMEVAQSVMDTTGNVVLGAPPHAEQRPFESFGLGMLLDGMHFKSERQAEDIGVIEEIFATGQAAPQFFRGILHHWKDENYPIIAAYAKAKLLRDLVNLAEDGHTTTLLHASNDHLARKRALKGAYYGAQRQLEGIRGHGPMFRRLKRTEVTGTDHNLGDRVGRLATLMAAALTRSV